jgi:hypothetical protein
MERQEIKFRSDGTFENSRLWIDKKEIYFEGLNISGNKQVDFDIGIVICQSKVTDMEMEEQLNPNKKLPSAIGFNCQEADADFYEDEDE